MSLTLAQASIIVDGVGEGTRTWLQAADRGGARCRRAPHRAEARGTGRACCGPRSPAARPGAPWGWGSEGASSRRAAGNPAFIQALSVASGGRVVPVPGGVLIRDKAGEIVGAVGISGDTSDNNETCAVYAIECAGLVPDTGDPA